MKNFLNSKREILIIAAIIAAAITWGWLNFDVLLNQGGDNARYIMLGRSIMEGKFMREVSTFKENLHTQYPPLFPLTLSVVMTVFGKENVFAMKLFSMLYYILSVFFFYKTLRLYFKESVLVLSLTALFVFCKNIVGWSSLILTESLFILTVILIIYSFKKYDVSKEKKYLYSLFAFSTLSVFIRGNGSLVFIPIAIYLLQKREWKNLTIMSVFALFSQLWGLYIYLSTGEGSLYFRQVLYKNWYLPHLGFIDGKTFAERLIYNSLNYFTTIIPTTFSAVIAPKIQYVLVLLAYMVSSVWGMVAFIKKKMLFESVWFVVSMAMLLLWPENFTTERFFAPFVSLLLILMGRAFVSYRKVEIVYYLSIGFLLISVFLNIYNLSFGIQRKIFMMSETDFNFRHDNRMRPEQGIRTFFDIANWAKDSLPEDAVVMTMKPELFYIHANRKAEIFPYTDNDSLIIEYMKERNVSYVMYENSQNQGRLSALTINKFLLSHEEWFSLVYTIPDRPNYMLLRLIKEL